MRRVRSNGEIKWRGDRLFLSETLIGELVGIVETETGDWLVRFCGLDLAVIGRRTNVIRRRSPQPVDLMDNANALPTTPQSQQQRKTT